jgi:nanoRNase/pAp phosphatase (c-di-AMP/oligoRNAs hydrolase)
MIQRGSVSTEYYEMLARGLLHARVRGGAILTDLGEVSNADILGELADLLLRHESIEWVLCLGEVRGTLWLSMRTARSGVKAGEVMQRIVRGIGTGGGHETAGGGQVPLEGADKKTRAAIGRKIRDRYRRVTGQVKGRSRKLIRP